MIITKQYIFINLNFIKAEPNDPKFTFYIDDAVSVCVLNLNACDFCFRCLMFKSCALKQ